MATSKELALWKKIKKPFKRLKELARGKSIIDLFKYCYPNLWRDVCDYHEDMVQWNAARLNKRRRAIYTFLSPEQYIDSRLPIKVGSISGHGKTQEEIDVITATIREQSLKKLRTRESKDFKRERYIQHTKPFYASQHIEMYYDVRKQHPEDIDSRYLIIHELAKYKCEDTIRFLKTLVRCEKNLHLQHFAWQKLNELGVTGVHKGRRKEKKKAMHIERYVPLQTPQELLKAIYNSPLEQMKHYDLFLSHSYKDKEKLVELKDTLNAIGLNIYMDWVNDRDELMRNLSCKETAKVITERIRCSKAILYVHTESSLESKWAPWELGFAYALNKPILVYRPEVTRNDPEYLQLYTPVKISKGRIIIDDDKETQINEWIKNLKI